jgi:hypothetical protein
MISYLEQLWIPKLMTFLRRRSKSLRWAWLVSWLTFWGFKSSKLLKDIHLSIQVCQRSSQVVRSRWEESCSYSHEHKCQDQYLLVQFPVWCESARSFDVLHASQWFCKTTKTRDPSGGPAPMPKLASVRK